MKSEKRKLNIDRGVYQTEGYKIKGHSEIYLNKEQKSNFMDLFFSTGNHPQFGGKENITLQSIVGALKDFQIEVLKAPELGMNTGRENSNSYSGNLPNTYGINTRDDNVSLEKLTNNPSQNVTNLYDICYHQIKDNLGKWLLRKLNDKQLETLEEENNGKEEDSNEKEKKNSVDKRKNSVEERKNSVEERKNSVEEMENSEEQIDTSEEE